MCKAIILIILSEEKSESRAMKLCKNHPGILIGQEDFIKI